jgi:two-component system response regulator (stage 0 sporulation protein F)
MTRILVVDDDPLIRTAIGAWLAGQNIEVVAADGARAGLKALDEHSAFDLMLIDIFMPDMEGLESIRIFRGRAPAMPIIAMSGIMFRQHHGSAPDFLGMATRMGATFCLHKPFRLKELLQAIAHCLPASPASVAREPAFAPVGRDNESRGGLPLA